MIEHQLPLDIEDIVLINTVLTTFALTPLPEGKYPYGFEKWYAKLQEESIETESKIHSFIKSIGKGSCVQDIQLCFNELTNEERIEHLESVARNIKWKNE